MLLRLSSLKILLLPILIYTNYNVARCLAWTALPEDMMASTDDTELYSQFLGELISRQQITQAQTYSKIRERGNWQPIINILSSGPVAEWIMSNM